MASGRTLHRECDVVVPSGARITTTTSHSAEADFGTTFWSRSFVLGAKSDYADASIVLGDITVDGVGPHARIQGDKVKLTTLAQSHPAYLVHHTKDGNENILYFSSGRFTVMIAGQSGTSVDQLVALGNALTGLR